VEYEVELKPRAVKDLRRLAHHEAARILDAIEGLHNDMAGDVKRLSNFTPEYRLRVGNYRVLFEVEATRVIIYRICHRQSAYKS